MRKILIIMDGASDSGINTPLNSANIPNLNYLALNGKTGLMYTLQKGIAPESDVGVMSILGYNPKKYYRGRGPLEMKGMNVKFKEFTAFRANFATAKNGRIIDRRVGRNLSTKESIELSKSINKIKLSYNFLFKPTIEHRGLFIIKKKLPFNITNTDIGYKKLGLISSALSKFSNKFEFSKSLDKESRVTAEIINEFTLKSIELLKNHPVNKKRISKGYMPANIILLRDPGNELPNFPKRKNWVAINSMPLEIGISKLMGFKVIKAPLGKDYYQNLKNVSDYAIKYLKKYPKKNFYIHFKETDIPGHDGNFKEKQKMLEYLDEIFFSQIKYIKDSIVIVTCDHATPTNLRSHSKDPVPVLVHGLGKDYSKEFNEVSCSKGSLHINHGYELLSVIQNL